MFRVRLESYNVLSGDLVSDLGLSVMEKCTEMEARGGEIRMGSSYDYRDNVVKVVGKVNGKAGDNDGGATDARAPLPAVDIRVSFCFCYCLRIIINYESYSKKGSSTTDVISFTSPSDCGIAPSLAPASPRGRQTEARASQK